MKKQVLVIILNFLLITGLYAYQDYPTNAGRPFHKYPAIEGRIIDAVTGMPVENVLVEVTWYKENLIGGPGGTSSSFSNVERMLTDKDGKWKVSSKITLHILSQPSGVVMNTSHPLYENKQVGIIYTQEDESYHPGRSSRKYKFVYNPDCELKDGKLSYTLKLTSLEEKYKNQPWAFHSWEPNIDLLCDEIRIFTKGNLDYYIKFVYKKRKNKIFCSELMESMDRIRKNVDMYDEKILLERYLEERESVRKKYFDRLRGGWYLDGGDVDVIINKKYIYEQMDKFQEKLKQFREGKQ
jgi:hypothetical protein